MKVIGADKVLCGDTHAVGVNVELVSVQLDPGNAFAIRTGILESGGKGQTAGFVDIAVGCFPGIGVIKADRGKAAVEVSLQVVA